MTNHTQLERSPFQNFISLPNQEPIQYSRILGVKDRGSDPKDKHRFAAWVTELRLMFQAEADALNRERLILSVNAPPTKYWIDQGKP